MKLNDKDDRNKTHRCLMISFIITREKRSAWVLFIDNVKLSIVHWLFLKKRWNWTTNKKKKKNTFMLTQTNDQFFSVVSTTTTTTTATTTTKMMMMMIIMIVGWINSNIFVYQWLYHPNPQHIIPSPSFIMNVCIHPVMFNEKSFEKKRHYIDSLLDRAMTMVFIYSRSAEKKTQIAMIWITTASTNRYPLHTFTYG